MVQCTVCTVGLNVASGSVYCLYSRSKCSLWSSVLSVSSVPTAWQLKQGVVEEDVAVGGAAIVGGALSLHNRCGFRSAKNANPLPPHPPTPRPDQFYTTPFARKILLYGCAENFQGYFRESQQILSYSCLRFIVNYVQYVRTSLLWSS